MTGESGGAYVGRMGRGLGEVIACCDINEAALPPGAPPAGAILKNQFNAAFQTASCDWLKRRCASTSAMNNRAEATVARWRARLQKVRYATMASLS